MYLKNADNYPVTENKYLGLKKEKKYWFPYFCRFFAWILIIGSVVASSTVLILYGMSFGMIKTYLWLTGIIYSFIMGILISTPVKIVVISLLDSLFIKRRPVVMKRKVNYTYLANPYDEENLIRVAKMRRYNKKLYEPRPLDRYKDRLEDVKYNLELRNMAVDVATFIFFLITIFYVVLINFTDMGFHSTQVLKNLVVGGKYTNSLPFSNVTTITSLYVYLDKTLLPSVLIDYRDYNNLYELRNLSESEYNRLISRATLGDMGFKTKKYKRDIRREMEELEERMKRQVEEKNKSTSETDKDSSMKGWTLDPAIKLIGKPRLRQIRVLTDSCAQLAQLKGRNPVCAPPLTSFNEETENFTLGWGSYPPRGLTPMQTKPWMHFSGWETGTLPMWCKAASYPSGGYVMDMAKNIEDSRVILGFMDNFKWIDLKTRAVFIEFTTYCANSNLFNVVTLIAEKTATGYIIPSYRIQSCRFLFMKVEVESVTILMGILFLIILFFCLFREGLRIHRTSMKHYFKKALALLDLSIIALSLLCVVFTILRYVYVTRLLRKLEDSSNNEFVSFYYAAYWHETTNLIKATLICLAAFKALRLLAFRVTLFQLQTTLAFCFKHFFILVIQTVAVILAFAFFFYLTVICFTHKFSTLPLTLSTLIGSSVSLSNTFDYEALSRSTAQVAPLFYVLFIVVITLLFVNVFIAVACVYLREVRKVNLIDKYRLLDYVRHSLTQQSDLLKLRSINVFPKEEPYNWLLRLKGGGRSIKSLKLKRQKRSSKKLTKKAHDRLTVRELATPKPYDVTGYKSLEPERETALCYLTIAELVPTLEERAAARQNAIKAIFLSFTTERFFTQNKPPGEYFIVVTPHGKQLKHKYIFCKMKVVVEKLARKEQWTTRDLADYSDVNQAAEKMDTLLKKIDYYVEKQTEAMTRKNNK